MSCLLSGSEYLSGRLNLAARSGDSRQEHPHEGGGAAIVFVASGVQAPVRDVAAEAGVGTATIYRHFPTRADLIVAVYRHQVEACAAAGPALLGSSTSPYAALSAWIDRFVDFLVTKHGLAAVLQSDDPCYDPLHAYFLERLVPVCRDLLAAATASGEISVAVDAVELMRGVGSLCIGADRSRGHDPRRLVDLLVAGLRTPDR